MVGSSEGLESLTASYSEGALRSEGVWEYGLTVLIFPALVYGTFVVFGGPEA